MKPRPRVTLRFSEETTYDVVAHTIVGAFAVHIFVGAKGKRMSRVWSVTHMTSGRRATLTDQTFENKQDAIAWAEHLQTFGDWEKEFTECCTRVRDWRAVRERLLEAC